MQRSLTVAEGVALLKAGDEGNGDALCRFRPGCDASGSVGDAPLCADVLQLFFSKSPMYNGEAVNFHEAQDKFKELINQASQGDPGTFPKQVKYERSCGGFCKKTTPAAVISFQGRLISAVTQLVKDLLVGGKIAAAAIGDVFAGRRFSSHG